MHDPWKLLSLAPDATVRDVKRRYAQLLKVNKPDDNPDGFALLRWAYENCLRHASGNAASVEISTETATTDESGENAAATGQRRPASNDREWIESLRSPAAVVEELLAVAAPQYAGSEPFVAWFTRCPEITSLAARPAVESTLLLHIADNIVHLREDAFAVLWEGFGWFAIDFEQRLLAQGLHPQAVRRILATLAPMTIDAQFAQHLASGDALCVPSEGSSYALGNAAAEAAILHRLHEERRQRPGIRRALWPLTVDDVVALVDAYAARYDVTAVDRLFGVDAVNAWRNLHRAAPPNAPQVLLRAVRVFLVTLVLLALMTLINWKMPAGRQWPIDSVWTLALSGAVALIVGGTVARWVRTVALVEWRAHRARMKDGMETFVQLPLAAILLWFLAPVIVWCTTQFAGVIAASCVAVVVVGYFFSGYAALGAAVLALGTATGIAFATPDAKPAIEQTIAAVPSVTWLFDRIVLFWKKLPTLHQRGPTTAQILAALGTAALIAGVALA